MIYFAPLIDPEKRRYAVAAAVTGCIGTLLFFIHDIIPGTDIGAYSICLGYVVITTLRFSLLAFSGFKPT